MEAQSPFEIRYRYEIVARRRDAELVRCGTAKPGTPGYETNKQLYGRLVGVSLPSTGAGASAAAGFPSCSS